MNLWCSCIYFRGANWDYITLTYVKERVALSFDRWFGCCGMSSYRLPFVSWYLQVCPDDLMMFIWTWTSEWRYLCDWELDRMFQSFRQCLAHKICSFLNNSRVLFHESSLLSFSRWFFFDTCRREGFRPHYKETPTLQRHYISPNHSRIYGTSNTNIRRLSVMHLQSCCLYLSFRGISSTLC